MTFTTPDTRTECLQVIYYIDGVFYRNLLSGDIRYGTASVEVSSSDFSNGTHSVMAKCVTKDRRSVELTENVVFDLKPPPPTISWDEQISQYISNPSSLIWIGGRVVENNGTLPARLSIRGWDFRKGWSKWLQISVAPDGTFGKMFVAHSASKVQVRVPAVDRTPSATSEIKTQLRGSIKISSPKSIKAKRWIYYRFDVFPKFAKELYCIETRNVYEDDPENPISWDNDVFVKIRGGKGVYKTLYLYPGSDATLNCLINDKSGNYYWAPKTRNVDVY